MNAPVSQFGKYQLLERLAVGGMAEVFKAIIQGEAGFTKPVVIKKLHQNFSDDPDFIQMFIDEARITAQLIHQNICQVIDLGQVGKDIYMAMEYIAGKDLAIFQKQFTRAGLKMPVDAAIYILSEMLSGLEYAHRKDGADGGPLKIIHRDISPQNVLISFEGEVKIIDFGIAKARGRLAHTEAGVIKGKFRYMAPEQASGESMDHRADLFACGIVLYELLKGGPHATDISDAELLRRIRNAEFEPLTNFRRDLPEDLLTIVSKALAGDPNQRFSSAAEFRLALLGHQQNNGLYFSRPDLAKLMQEAFKLSQSPTPDESFRGGAVGRTPSAVVDSMLEASRERFLGNSVSSYEVSNSQVMQNSRGGSAAVSSSSSQVKQGGWDLTESISKAPPTFSKPGQGFVSLTPQDMEPADEVTDRRSALEQSVIPSQSNLLSGSGIRRGPSGNFPGTPSVPNQSFPQMSSPRVLGQGVSGTGQTIALKPTTPSAMNLPLTTTASKGNQKRLVINLLLIIPALLLLGGAIYFFVQGSGTRKNPVIEGESQEALVKVRTNPSGARVLFCGQEQASSTPTVLKAKVGKHCLLDIQLDGFEPVSLPLMPASTEPQTIMMTMRKLTGNGTNEPIELLIKTSDVGTVYVNGKALGRTPNAKIPLPPGNYDVYVHFPKTNFKTPVKQVTLSSSKKGEVLTFSAP